MRSPRLLNVSVRQPTTMEPSRMRARITSSVLSVLAICGGAMVPVGAEQNDFEGRPEWATSISTSSSWAVFRCKDYLIVKRCGADKDYSDPGVLPSIISVGDTITYKNARDENRTFVVRHIRFFVYEHDVHYRLNVGQTAWARKGDTTCTLYDTVDRDATRDSESRPKIVITGCAKRP